MQDDFRKLKGTLCTLSLPHASLAAGILYRRELVSMDLKLTSRLESDAMQSDERMLAARYTAYFEYRLRELADRLDELSADSNVVEIDRRLEQLADQWHPSIVAVAMSVYVSGASGPTGGILGFPRHPWTPAGKYIEQGPQGLCLCGMPGGPGVLVAGDFTHAKGLFNRCALSDGRLLAPSKIVDAIQKEGIATALWVTDGCGASAVGRVGLYEQGRVEEINLRNLHEQSDQKNRRQPD